MEKISNEKIASVLKHAASAVAALSDRNQYLEGELAKYQIQEHSRKVASQMFAKGLSDAASEEKLATELAKSPERLAPLEQAVALIGPNMGKMAQIQGGPSDGVGATASELERYLMGRIP